MERRTKQKTIKESIRLDIVNGRFKQKLPGIRVLAEHYHVHFSTIHRALEQLKKEGYLVRFHGSGSYVPPDKRIQNAGILLFREKNTTFPKLKLEVVCKLAEKLLARNINLQIFSVVDDSDQEKFINQFKMTAAKMASDLIITFRLPPFLNVEEYIDKPVIQISSQHKMRPGYFITAEWAWSLSAILQEFINKNIDNIGILLPDHETPFGEESRQRIIRIMEKTCCPYRNQAEIRIVSANRIPTTWDQGKLPDAMVVYEAPETVAWLEKQAVNNGKLPQLIFIGNDVPETLRPYTLSIWQVPVDDFISAILEIINNIITTNCGYHSYIMVNHRIQISP